jgi:hypothetical protein
MLLHDFKILVLGNKQKENTEMIYDKFGVNSKGSTKKNADIHS